MDTDLQPRPVERASYPPRPGNRVSVLIDGLEAFRRIFEVAAGARRSLWITVSFVQLDLPVPGRDVSLLDFLDAVAARGVDVRLLFWWSEFPGIGSFRGEADEINRLRERGSRIKMRWDHIHRGCHHQKSHVVDGEIAFVGGINLSGEGLSDQDHEDEGYHDLFAELHGPAVADVAANFVQRWNQASETRTRGHAYPSPQHANDVELAASERVTTQRGAWVQVVRTIRAGLYRGSFGWNGNGDFDLADGEHSVRDSVFSSIEHATERIYIENQFLMDPETIGLLAGAAGRGVEIIAVVPSKPDPNLKLYPDEDLASTRGALAELARHESFGMFGLVDPSSPSRSIYVHTKLMIIDDRLMTLGSANFWPPSYDRDSELNLCVWDTTLCGATRRRLWEEHLLGHAAAGLDDWRSLASNGHRSGDDGGRRRTRLTCIDPVRYYAFGDDVIAPWKDLQEVP